MYYQYPFYYLPFNGDAFLMQEVFALINKNKIDTVVQTGTCYGGTTSFFKDVVKNVHSVQIDEKCYNFSKSRLTQSNVHFHLGSSPEILQTLLPSLPGKKLFYLDAHNANACPLLQQIQKIGKYCKDSIIVIHDFMVPNKRFGYDTYNGHPLNMEYISKKIEHAYTNGYDYSYNKRAQGAARGAIYIYPKLFNSTCQ